MTYTPELTADMSTTKKKRRAGLTIAVSAAAAVVAGSGVAANAASASDAPDASQAHTKNVATAGQQGKDAQRSTGGSTADSVQSSQVTTANLKDTKDAVPGSQQHTQNLSTGAQGSSQQGSSQDGAQTRTVAAITGGSGSSAKSTARSMMSSSDFQCFSNIVERESGWNPKASNASSGAYGLVQALPASKMSSAGSDWKTNPKTQIKWGLNYMKDRYGSPCAAWSHWQSAGSY